MSDIYQQSNDSESLSLDREKLGRLLVRHPWTVRFAAVELALLSLVGVIPFFGEGAFYYVLFGIVASLAGFGAIVFIGVGLFIAVRRGVASVRHSALDLAR